MFKYKVNSRLLPQLRALHQYDAEDSRGSFSIELTTHEDAKDPQSPRRSIQDDIVQYPLFRNSSSKRRKTTSTAGSVRHRESLPIGPLDPEPNANIPLKTIVQEREPEKPADDDAKKEGELHINIELDFGYIFGWLERIIWLTMFISVGWSLFYNFEKATRELCTQSGNNNTEHNPFNILPSLSRSMSSFRVGKFIWTITMAGVFVARLLSNYFLHRLYESWYEGSWFNKAYLGLAYLLDTLEIISLVMIPAFSLDCDPGEHSVFFRVFICLTYTAEVLQYLTRFLKRKKGVVLFSEDVNNYYKAIGILIILQTLFIGVMMVGYILHDKLCEDLYYSIFTLGEYITVIINVRFKRNTVLFVK